MYCGTVHRPKKRWNIVICDNMDWIWEYHGKQINQMKKVKNHDFTHMSDKKLKAKSEQIRKTNK